MIEEKKTRGREEEGGRGKIKKGEKSRGRKEERDRGRNEDGRNQLKVGRRSEEIKREEGKKEGSKRKKW